MYSQSLYSVTQWISWWKCNAWNVLQELRNSSLRLFKVLIIIVWGLVFSNLSSLILTTLCNLFLFFDWLSSLYKVIDNFGIREVWVLLIICQFLLVCRGTVSTLILTSRTLYIWIWLEIFDGWYFLFRVRNVKVTRILNLKINYLVIKILPSHYQHH